MIIACKTSVGNHSKLFSDQNKNSGGLETASISSTSVTHSKILLNVVKICYIVKGIYIGVGLR